MRSFIIYTRHQNMNRMIKSSGMRWAGHVARMGEMKVCARFLFKSLKGRAFGRPGRRWEYNIKMDLREVGCGLDLSGTE
jgi:hypothetical protein